MGYELKGTIIKLFEAKQVSERFTKRELVVETADNPKYPQPVLMQITGDKISQLDGLSVGDEVRADFSVRGRAWSGGAGDTKYYVSLDIWKIERVGAAKTTRDAAGPTGADDSDSMPF
jgi:hypothetical protein